MIFFILKFMPIDNSTSKNLSHKKESGVTNNNLPQYHLHEVSLLQRLVFADLEQCVILLLGLFVIEYTV